MFSVLCCLLFAACIECMILSAIHRSRYSIYSAEMRRGGYYSFDMSLESCIRYKVFVCRHDFSFLLSLRLLRRVAKSCLLVASYKTDDVTLNQRVAGSTPARLTSKISRDRDLRGAALDLSLFFGLIVNTLRLQAKRPSILLL